MALQNDLILRTLKGEKTERKPIWLMRQAGRILPEYRAVRNSLSGFKELVETPERAAEVTIQPIDILKTDAAIIFSDILVVPEAMGLPYEMIEKKGANFPNTIQSEEDLQKIKVADVESDLGYVLEAIKVTKKELNDRVPLIGFAGAPWTIFAYMIEGQGSKTFSKAKKMLYTNPELSHKLLGLITETTIKYLNAQAEAGADLVQVFDSWAGILSPILYKIFALPYIAKICDNVTQVPKIVFAKGSFFVRKEMGALNCQALGLDWTMDAQESRALIGEDKVLQGNLDPCALYADLPEIKSSVQTMLDSFDEKHSVNLGHGVYPDTDFTKVQYFIETVKELSAK